MRIADAKVLDATRITDIEEDVFECWCQDITSQRTFTSKNRNLYVNLSDLSKIWQIVIGAAAKTLNAMTQRMLISSIMPILIRYRPNRIFERPCIKGGIFTDTMEGQYKSFDGNFYAQVFTNNSCFAATYPI